MALRDPLGAPAGRGGGPQAREAQGWGGWGFLAGAGRLRQSPNVGLRGRVRREAPLLYITNLQREVSAENFLPEH